jgi:enterochelin esterase-like enzyme
VTGRRLCHYLLFLFILLAAGCAGASAPLPTYVPTAGLPFDRPAPSSAGLPATYTAVAPLIPVSAAQPVEEPAALEPTPTLQATATLFPSPTPLVFSGQFPYPIDAPYWDTPPQATDCAGKGTVFRSRFPSGLSGRWRSYHVYLPPCYGSDGRVYPVLYLIHGSIQTDSHWLDLGLATYADAGIAGGRYPPFIAIMPFSDELGNLSSGGERSVEGVTVDHLLPYVESNYCAWADRVGRNIGGISRGGYWALEMAFLHPDLFGAVSGHSSHLRFETDPPKYNPLATYGAADLSGTRIWLDRGETDFLRVGQDQLHDLLNAAGIDHEFRINPGGHNEAYWAAHLAEYIDWHAAGWPRARTLYPRCLDQAAS